MLTRLKELIYKIPVLRSMKVYIFLLMLIMGILPSIFMRIGILQSYEERAVDLRTSDTQTQFKIIANHLLNNNYLQDTSSEAINAELEQMSNLYDGRVIIINSNFRVVKDTYSISEGKTMISEEVILCFKGQSRTKYDKKNGYIEMTIPIEETTSGKNQTGAADAVKKENGSQVQGVMLASVSTDSIAATMELLNRKALIIEIVMIICIFGVAVGFSTILVKPFNRVTQAITEVKDGFTDEPIAVPDYIETEHIIDAFNQLLTQMKVIDDSRQEFVSNVSHELKTPLTSMKVLADSLMQQQDAPVELYQEFMQDIVSEIDRESKIIEDLLTLVRMDKSAATLNISSVNMNELLEMTLKRLKPLAQKKNIELLFESFRPVVAQIDEVKMTQVISNLVENSIKYNVEDGWVHVSLNADYQYFYIRVEDSGIGIPEESINKIFERFYRVDKARSRETGGTGLGLAIVKNIILMHHGTIKVHSEENIGTTFTMRIPLNYVDSQQ